MLVASAWSAGALLVGIRPPHRRTTAVSMGTSDNMFGEMIKITPGDKTFMVGVDIKQNKYKTLDSSWDVNDSLGELRRLCETAGLEVVGRDIQNMQHPNPSTFVGSGKVQEIAVQVEEKEVSCVVFDDELTPGQGRNLQKAFGGKVQVIDRTMLILQIFSQRARTKEAMLQVQAAQLEYMMPRLQTYLTTGAGMDAKGGASSGGGGQFLKGAGESQLEMDKRLFRGQLQKIKAEMEEIAEKRQEKREKRRERDDLPKVAIVGYTNAGKSTLLNKLCSSEEVYADDLLFATLDPTTRRVNLPGGKEVLFSDTVGFIQKLPTKLVSAFRATLEELQEANLILHVVDAASPLVLQHVSSVQSIVDDLQLSETSQILVLNKADRMAEAVKEGRPDYAEDSEPLMKADERVTPMCAVCTSARSGNGVEELLEMVELALLQTSVLVECTVPYKYGEFLAKIHKVGTVLEEDFAESGTRIVAYLPPSLRNKLQAEKLLVKGQSGFSPRLERLRAEAAGKGG
jgi:GTP-binding protein HflX